METNTSVVGWHWNVSFAVVVKQVLPLGLGTFSYSEGQAGIVDLILRKRGGLPSLWRPSISCGLILDFYHVVGPKLVFFFFFCLAPEHVPWYMS